MSIKQKNFMRNWRQQLWLLVFTAGLSCLGQTAQLPLGATPKPGGTTFRLWAPFVDSVAVKVNNSDPVPMSKESGHTQADDTTWVAEVIGAIPTLQPFWNTERLEKNCAIRHESHRFTEF